MYYIKRYIKRLDKSVTITKTHSIEKAINICNEKERTFIVCKGKAIYANKI